MAIDELEEDIQIDLLFSEEQPNFGDLFTLTGDTHPKFPPSGAFDFASLVALGFEQADDYFGIANDSEDGDDIVVWLYPLKDGEVVDHDPGPFDGIRLTYSVLRNLPEKVETFLACVSGLGEFADGVIFEDEDIGEDLGQGVDMIRGRIDDIIEGWKDEGIEVGTDEALEV